MNMIRFAPSSVSRGPNFDLARIASADGVVVIGSSASGKSHLLRQARASELARSGIIGFPLRLITRAKRLNEDLQENGHVSHAQMDVAKSSGRLAVWWTRDLGSLTPEVYGFTKPTAGAYPIYSANNALVRTKEPQVERFLATKVIVGVYASDAARRKRLRQRNPDLFDLKPEEVARRLGDSASSILPFCDYVIRNEEASAVSAPDGFVSLLSTLSGHQAFHLTKLASL